MKTSKLFQSIEKKIPPNIALNEDKIGFFGSKSILEENIEKVLVLMDYLPLKNLEELKKQKILNYNDFDLMVLHHPPPDNIKLEYPVYIIHSNWDIVPGGACDALADTLNITTSGVLDHATGLGRLGNLNNGPVYLEEFMDLVQKKLDLDYLRVVNDENTLINDIALVSGFGLNPYFINLSYGKGVDLYLSGDLTHPGAILAKNLGIKLIDATHHATEIPGLYRLGEVISDSGVEVQIFDSDLPWNTHSR
ncbi:Nif3-like dinuclear metal center hexameric protein [Methanobacterium alcaliphilum]|uniref:Nif3-like dinuclear metal center hexameric protein n=1 Tax=Methanobacterium alcaliphilum TaxID=392018 RepID=UPI002009F2E3|nr:Nif3-like dinuclear metal center hexameric protein [Methanobacterium alcaliphilum]MCK9152529.1 Nif3-like dinuclear metal center hexameric protein [Methanobacterium alcaliphilum]